MRGLCVGCLLGLLVAVPRVYADSFETFAIDMTVANGDVVTGSFADEFKSGTLNLTVLSGSGVVLETYRNLAASEIVFNSGHQAPFPPSTVYVDSLAFDNAAGYVPELFLNVSDLEEAMSAPFCFANSGCTYGFVAGLAIPEQVVVDGSMVTRHTFAGGRWRLYAGAAGGDGAGAGVAGAAGEWAGSGAGFTAAAASRVGRREVRRAAGAPSS